MGQYELALEALRSLKPGEKLNISLVARTYGVDPSNLSKRFRGVTGSKEAQYNNQRLLSKEQSRALIKWINQLTERGLPPTNSMLENFAREISGKEPGKNWASRWLKAHSDKVISRYSKGLDSDRKKADSAYKYTLYFELIGQKIEQYNLTPDQIYNMDEKGFMLGVSTKERESLPGANMSKEDISNTYRMETGNG
uniref:Jerky protein like-like n=1 Tax=Talaromyces marneffei PM1 TaxID=1077442 RepID=A0A093Y585_TALMA